jgi:hypothetical protein
MNTSQPMPLITGLLSDDPLDAVHLGYLRARAQNRAHDCVLQVFLDEAQSRGINKAYIARRLGKRPEVIGRWLTAPGNWVLDTLAELLGSMGYEIEFRARSLRSSALPNRIHDLALADFAAKAPRASALQGGHQIIGEPKPTLAGVHAHQFAD